MVTHFKYVIYKITFPNDKIYIGKDEGGLGHSLRYFGSWSNDLVASDFTKDELRSFTLKKEILFESDDKILIRKKEIEFIKLFNSTDPEIGYNRVSGQKKPRSF